MKKRIQSVLNMLNRNHPMVMAVILCQEGSTPRSAGSWMLVDAEGAITGTVGGGRIEAMVMKTARDMMGKPGAVIRSFDLTSEIAESMDMICGGKMEILLDAILPDETVRGFFQDLLQALEQRQKGLMVTEMVETPLSVLETRRGVLLEDGRVIGDPDVLTEIGAVSGKLHAPVLEISGGRRRFIEPISPSCTLYLLGAGHVSLQTAILAKKVGFETVVLDDRKEFANTIRFSDADAVRVLPSFEHCFEGFDIHADSYIVILTRGHLHDKTVLRQALQTPAGYIGMIGSRKKRDAIYRALEMEGFSTRDFEKVHCPIGLSIGAQSPEEIAVSIVAELIHVRALR